MEHRRAQASGGLSAIAELLVIGAHSDANFYKCSHGENFIESFNDNFMKFI